MVDPPLHETAPIPTTTYLVFRIKPIQHIIGLLRKVISALRYNVLNDFSQ